MAYVDMAAMCMLCVGVSGMCVAPVGMVLKLVFPMGRDSATFRDKGTTGQARNLGRHGPGQPKSGTGRGTKRDIAEKDVLKQEKDVLKQKKMF